MDQPNLWELYELMTRSRLFEEAVKKIWDDGMISGEMHMGIGEEAIIAGIVSQLQEGDALALDHRGSSASLMRGVDPVQLLLEFMGHPEGLCKGLGGHMHLFSEEHLLASSGIVGASGPAACGFAMAAQYNRTKNITVAFFGESSMNQGMLMESMNLASAWNLPVLFVCKDNKWAITTVSEEQTGGTLIDRAEGFGIDGIEIDGTDVRIVWETANQVIREMREKSRPFFIHAHCDRKDGHFLGDALLRFVHEPVGEFGKVTGPLTKTMIRTKGVGIHKRLWNMTKTMALISRSRKQLKDNRDAYLIFQKQLADEPHRLDEIQESVKDEIDQIVQRSMEIFEGGIHK